MSYTYPNVAYQPQSQTRLEALLSAHSASLPTTNNGQPSARVFAAAALSEAYPPRMVEKALDFIQLVRLHLAGRPGAYDQVFKALKLYEEGRVELVDVLVRLMIMLRDVPLLLEELNYFLPPDYCYGVSMQMQTVELQTPTQTLRQPINTAFS